MEGGRPFPVSRQVVSVMNPLVYQILGGLLVIGYIVLLVMCWKTWRITHIMCSFLVFGGICTFLAFSSLVLKTHAAWRSLYVQYEKALEKSEADKLKLLQGDLVEVEQKEESIRSLRAQLTNVVIDRGRIWRECRPVAAVDADTVRVSTVPASLPATEQPKPSGIQPKQILYVFSEKDTSEGWKVPAAYLGEFTVDEATENEVTLSTTLPLDPDQIQKIQAGGATWALFELMPLDGYEVFAVLDPNENMLVGMDKEELKLYVPNEFNWPPEKFDKLLDTFYRFNRPTQEGDPPENTWLQVRFLKPHKIQVDSDAEQPTLESTYFDASGRAVVRTLRRGEEGTVEFEVGDTGVFDQTTADTLIADGVCEKVKPVYRRLLHDYEHFFHDTFHRHLELDDSIRRATRDRDEMVALKTRAEEQVAFHQGEKDRCQQELAKFQLERTEVTAYAQRLEAGRLQTLQRLSQLYQENYRLAEELKQLQYRLAEQINQRSMGTTAQTPAPAPAP